MMGASALVAATSNLLLRHAMGGIGDGGMGAILVSAIQSPMVLAGIVGYALSQLLWLNVLATARLGAAFPIFVSLTFIMVMAGAIALLGEAATVYRLGGAACVAAGIVVAEWQRPKRAQSR